MAWPWRGGWTGRRGGEGPAAAPPDTRGRNGREANGLGFSRERQPAPGFDPAKSTESRRIRSDGQDRPRAAGDGAGQIRPRWEGSFPAQAHAVALDAGALRRNGPRAGFATGPRFFGVHSKVCQLFYSFSEAFPIVLILYSNLNQRNNLS